MEIRIVTIKVVNEPSPFPYKIYVLNKTANIVTFSPRYS